MGVHVRLTGAVVEASRFINSKRLLEILILLACLFLKCAAAVCMHLVTNLF